MIEKAKRYVAYLRVSTDKQGRSGLGLEAQRDTIATYLRGTGGEAIAEFVEVESGKLNTRRQLAAAMYRAKVTGAKLLIAKLDRLSRNVSFIAALQESGVKFVCADMPEANELTVHLLAAMAQHERKMISERTKAALAAAKRRGTKLGNPNGARALKGLRERPCYSDDRNQCQAVRRGTCPHHRRHSRRRHQQPQRYRTRVERARETYGQARALVRHGRQGAARPIAARSVTARSQRRRQRALSLAPAGAVQVVAEPRAVGGCHLL